MKNLYLFYCIYCGMIGINDSLRFVVFVGSFYEFYMFDKNK